MTGALRTPLCDLLGIDVPILSVGFGISAGPELVTAVSEAGGCGVLGGSGVPRDEIVRRVRAVREVTVRPFGVNFIIADFEADDSTDEDRAEVREPIDAVIAERVPLVVLFWGPAEPFVAAAHDAGTKVLIQVGSVAEARAAVEVGVDAVIAQGVEAGGHIRGTASIWALLPEVVRSVAPTPVLASGGIGDGIGVARALRLGAQGVSLGTRFVATDEAFVHPVYKERVVGSRAEDTYYGELIDVGWPDAPHRILRNGLFRRWDEAGRPPTGQRPGEGTTIGVNHRPWADVPWRRYSPGMLTTWFDGDPDDAPMWAGESCSVVTDVRPAAEIVRRLARDAEAELGEALAP
jgi:nitronate monooxygenase